MQKNVASQKWIVFAFDRTDNTAKTGDAANITANLRLDGGVANGVDDTNPTELEDGYYVFDITQAETNADLILISPQSSTSNIQVIGVPGAAYTTPAAFPTLTKGAIVDEIETQSQADPTGFHVNVKEINGTAQTANDNGADINDILTDTGTTLDALIKDIPTVAEFEARSILAANYVVVSDTIAGVTAVTNDVGITQAGADKVWGTAARALTDKAGFGLSTAGILAIWHQLTANIVTADTIGKLLKDDIDATISSRSSHNAAAIWSAGSRALSTPTDYKADVSSLALEATLTAMKGATFAEATDSLEAIRDRGDSAWVTGAGGSDRLLMIDTTIATLASQTSFTLTAGSADDEAYNNCTIVIENSATATQKAVGIISNYVGASKTVTLKYDPGIFTMATTDKVYILAENALKATLANRQLNVAADGDVAGNVDGSVASVVGHTVQTGDSYAIVNHGTYGNSVIEALVDELESRLTAARAGYLDNINNAQLANVPNLTSLTREQLAFPDGRVWFDAATGSAGTTFPIGTATSPSSNVANTKTIADNNNLCNIQIHGAFQLGEAWENYSFFGHLHEIIANKFDLNGQDVDGSNLNNLFVSGAQGGTGDLIIDNCFLYAVTNFNGIACCCDLYGSAMSIKDGGTVDLTDCNAIHSVLTLTLNAPTRFSLKNGKGNCTLTGQDGGIAFVRGFEGSLIIASMTGGTLTIYGDSGTDITINATCTAGAINIFGDCNITDSSGAGCTVNDYTMYSRTKGLDDIHDDLVTVLADVTGINGDAMRGTDSAALASVCTEARLAELAAANLPADVDAIKTKTDNLPSGIQKNVALNNFTFLMTDTSDDPKTGLTVTVQVSKDGGTFTNSSNSVTEIANGYYKINLTQAEMNADVIGFKATATGANQTSLVVVTS